MSKSRTETEEGLDDIIAQHKAHIAKHGFTVQGVLPDEDQPPYTYTIGLTQTFNHPELFLAGLRPDDAMGIIIDVIDLIRKGIRFDKPVFAAGIIPGYEIPFRPMSQESVLDHGAAGLELIGPFDGVQIFYPDPEGFVPWEEGCDPRYKSQLFFEVEGEEPRRNMPLEEARKLVPQQPRLSPEEIAENRRRIIEDLRKDITEYGFVPQAVGGNGEQPGFLYTIGLTTTWNHPELYVVGLNPEQAYDIVAGLVDRISEGERFDTPAYVDDVLNVPIAVRPLGQKDVDDNSGIAQDTLGRTISALQVYWPDREGLMPWEEGCEPEIAGMQLSIFTPEGAEPVRLQAPPGVSMH